MKNIFKKIVYALILSLIITTKVNAATLSFDGLDKISKGTSSSQKIMLKLETDEKINNVEFELELSDTSNASYGVKKATHVLGEANLSKSYIQSSSETFLTSGELATLMITNTSSLSEEKDIIVKIVNIKFTYDDGEVKTGTDYSKQITLIPEITTTPRPKNNNASLTGLTFSSGSLTPKFESSITEYKVFGIKDTIKTITITPKCENCSFIIKCESGCVNYNNQQRPDLEIGKNIIKISTISESGNNTLEYFLTVYRGETTDNSAFLKDIVLEDLKLNEKFDKETLDYTITIPNDLNELPLEVIPEDEAATVEIRGNENFIVGDNVVTITVTSADTEEKSIYNITVTKLEEGEVVITTTSPVIEQEEKKDNKTLVIILIILAGLIIIGISGYFIFFRKKKKNKKKPEIITDEGNIKTKEKNTEISVKENELIDELNMTDKKIKPTIDEALTDLMNTKELIFDEK